MAAYKKVKSSDVLDPNVITLVEVSAAVIGRFRRTGPNKWDDFELVPVDEPEVVTVNHSEKVYLEPLGARPEIRLRARLGREVLRLRWKPTSKDEEAIASGEWGVRESEAATFWEKVFGTGPKDDPRDDMLEYFLDRKVEPFAHEKGMGEAAMLAKELSRK